MRPEILSPAEQELISILRLRYSDPWTRFLDIIELIYAQPAPERVGLMRSLVRWRTVIPISVDILRTDPFPFSEEEKEAAAATVNTLVQMGVLASPGQEALGITADEIAATVMKRLDMLDTSDRCTQAVWLICLMIRHPAFPVRDEVFLTPTSEEEAARLLDTLCAYPSLLVEIESILHSPDTMAHDIALWLARLSQQTEDLHFITAFTQYVLVQLFTRERKKIPIILSNSDGTSDESPIDPKKAN